MMLRASTVVRRDTVEPERVIDTLTLGYEARHRRRITLITDQGLSFLLDLDRPAIFDDGDAVRLDDSRLVEVRAAPERLVEITSDDPLRLKKIIWHLGNRHVPAEITEAAVYIAEDHVLVEMVRGLGATATPVLRPFRPERGAYESANGHHHGAPPRDAHD